MSFDDVAFIFESACGERVLKGWQLCPDDDMSSHQHPLQCSAAHLPEHFPQHDLMDSMVPL